MKIFQKLIKPNMKIGDSCPKCGKGFLKNFPILGTDFSICSENCGYKIYSSEKIEDTIEERFKLFMADSWAPPQEKIS